MPVKWNTVVNPLSKPASLNFFSVPRNQDVNTVLDIDFDIELGNTADEAKDDPGKGNTFENQLKPCSKQTSQLKRWLTSPIFHQHNETDSKVCSHGGDIAVTRCVVIGTTPGGDTWHLAVSYK